MDKQTIGTIVKVRKMRLLKVNSKPVRLHPLDGATFPHIIKVSYSVDGTEFVKRKWIHPGQTVPKVGSNVQVIYSSEKPSKSMVL